MLVCFYTAGTLDYSVYDTVWIDTYTHTIKSTLCCNEYIRNEMVDVFAVPRKKRQIRDLKDSNASYCIVDAYVASVELDVTVQYVFYDLCNNSMYAVL